MATKKMASLQRVNIMLHPLHEALLAEIAEGNPELSRSGVIRGLLLLINQESMEKIITKAHSPFDVAHIVIDNIQELGEKAAPQNLSEKANSWQSRPKKSK